MIYLNLIWSFFQIGLLSFGGGYAALPLIQNQVVELHGWLNMTEFADITTISQMTPGPIAINAATFVGQRMAGLPGALAATFGCVLPSCIIVLLLAVLYYKFRTFSVMESILSGLRPAVVALIAVAGWSLIQLAFWNQGKFSLSPQDLDLIAVALFGGGFFVLRKWRINPIYVMAGSGLLGLCLYSFL